MNSMNSASRSPAESSAMMHGAMLHTVLTNTRLTGEVRAFFLSHTSDYHPEITAELATSVMAASFTDAIAAGKQNRMSTQFVLKAVALTCARLDDAHIDTIHHEDFKLYLNIAKRFVQAYVADGSMLYHPEVTKFDGTKTQAYYALSAAALKRSIAELLHQEPCVDERFITKGTEHEAGALAMSEHRFSINIERAKECREWLEKGYFMNRKGFWQAAQEGNKAEQAKLLQQRQTFEEAKTAWRTAPNGWHYKVKADFRGRLYYISGMLNPQAGGIASYILMDDSLVTYDSTASFAQFISVVTGDAALAATCNLTNYSDTVHDFYGSVYAMAAGVPCPAKNTFEREVAKSYLMPKAYGSGDETSRNRAIQMAADAGEDVDAAAAIVESLKNYNGLNTVKNAASAAATVLAENGDQLQWLTPSGFRVKQNYWELDGMVWNTGSDYNEYIPTAITFRERSKRVAVDRDEANGGRSAVVAAAANFIQSLDAAFMAKVQARFHKETGATCIGIHDSFTFNAEHVEIFHRIAWAVFCEMAFSTALEDMRACIGLPRKKELVWLNPNKIPKFIDKE